MSGKWNTPSMDTGSWSRNDSSNTQSRHPSEMKRVTLQIPDVSSQLLLSPPSQDVLNHCCTQASGTPMQYTSDKTKTAGMKVLTRPLRM